MCNSAYMETPEKQAKICETFCHPAGLATLNCLQQRSAPGRQSTDAELLLSGALAGPFAHRPALRASCIPEIPFFAHRKTRPPVRANRLPQISQPRLFVARKVAVHIHGDRMNA